MGFFRHVPQKSKLFLFVSLENFMIEKRICRKIRRNLALRSCILFESTRKVHRHISHSLVHFDIRNIYQVRMENKMLVLGVCIPQACSSADRRFGLSRLCSNHNGPIRSFPQKQIR